MHAYLYDATVVGILILPVCLSFSFIGYILLSLRVISVYVDKDAIPSFRFVSAMQMACVVQ